MKDITPYYQDDYVTLYCGKSESVLIGLPDNSVDSIVTDPPYELGFMGKKWDNSGIAYSVPLWKECLRVLKPGGHLLAFGGTRTSHRMVCAIEDAGFEIRDSLIWMYGSGFPKNLDISKAIDKSAGNAEERGYIKTTGGLHGGSGNKGKFTGRQLSNNPVSEDTKKWNGWGTALKPAHEPICVARKPLSEKTIAANVLKWGTGGLNIDGSRIGMQEKDKADFLEKRDSWANSNGKKSPGFMTSPKNESLAREAANKGRFPANVLLGCACEGEHEPDCAVRMLDEQSGESKSVRAIVDNKGSIWGSGNNAKRVSCHNDSSGASRFFYTAKATRAERLGSKHPTVKPLDLMKYLVQLVTPPQGTVLDLFAGSGTTLQAAKILGFKSVGIDMVKAHCQDCVERLRQEVLALEEPKEEPVPQSLQLTLGAKMLRGEAI